MSRRLVLFDFDGTLTTSDTFLEFIRFYRGTAAFLTGFVVLSPVLVAMKLKLIRNDRAKQIVLKWFFGGEPLSRFKQRCEDFAQQNIPALITPSARLVLDAELKLKSRIIVVSASPENWVKPWCDTQNIECLATRLEVIDQKITGKIEGENCYGSEKVTRIKQIIDPARYDQIIAYGDSRGDKEMLGWAKESHYREL